MDLSNLTKLAAHSFGFVVFPWLLCFYLIKNELEARGIINFAPPRVARLAWLSLLITAAVFFMTHDLFPSDISWEVLRALAISAVTSFLVLMQATRGK